MVDKLRNFVHRLLGKLPHPWRWIATVLLGFVFVVAGTILLPLPGPGALVIFVGVGILAVEFEWAREVMRRGEQGLEQFSHRLRSFFKREK